MTKNEVKGAEDKLLKIIEGSIPSPRKLGDPICYYPIEDLAGWTSQFGLLLVKDSVRLRKENRRLRRKLNAILAPIDGD